MRILEVRQGVLLELGVELGDLARHRSRVMDRASASLKYKIITPTGNRLLVIRLDLF